MQAEDGIRDVAVTGVQTCTLPISLGGSTNAIIHLVAMAGRAGATLDLDRFDALSRRTPFLANIRPSGTFLMEDLYYAGGLSGVTDCLPALLHVDLVPVSGRRLGQGVQRA